MKRYLPLASYDRRYILDEPSCHQLQIFNWLRLQGAKNLKWYCHMPNVRYNKVHIVQFHFNDEAIEALFKLTFANHFMDMSVVAYSNLFINPRILPNT